MQRFLIFIKRLLSYKKASWNFNDYPVRTWKNPNAGELKLTYGAGISNWPLMSGHGETKEKAMEDLKSRFQLYKENNEHLPRPGAKVPIKFYTTEQISKYEELAVDFFKKVLNMDYYKGFYSDGSGLEHFEPPEEEQAKSTRKEIIRRTLAIYNVDISDVYDEPLYVVFEKIKNNK